VSELRWYAAYTRPRHEGAVATSLDRRGYGVLFPRYRMVRKWSDRVKQVDAPLFPSYIFVQCDAGKRLPVLQTPGLIYLVSNDNGPLPVPEVEVENLRRAMFGHARMEPTPFLNTGDRVCICRGPLTGLQGILLAQRSGLRVVISVQMLARSVAVEIEGAWLERAVLLPAVERQ